MCGLRTHQPAGNLKTFKALKHAPHYRGFDAEGIYLTDHFEMYQRHFTTTDFD